MQGNLDSGRRDYLHTFSSLQLLADEAKRDGKIAPLLYLLGQGSLKIPASLVDLIFVKAGLQYPDYYSTLRGATALLPSFANDDYLRNKASSSIPAALIAGTPPVVTQKLLDCYTYLDEGSVITQQGNESELDAAIRFSHLAPKIRGRTLVSLLRLRKSILQQNRRNLDEWIFSDTSALFT
ncbi:hypothetical protein CBS101457_005018 [Exobasidium rhododendri]|nr:hypothetical protein CBS101457_005018 [Exobasidium rhododendri]